MDLAGKRLAVVGPHTSFLLDEIGFKSDFMSNNAAELCQVILDECEGLRWLYLKGNISLDIISSIFSNSGHSVDELVVYETEKNVRCGARIADYVSNNVDKVGDECGARIAKYVSNDVDKAGDECGARIADYVSNNVDKAGDEIISSAEQWVVFFSPSGVMYSKDAILEHFSSTVRLVAFGPSTAKEVGKWFEGYEIKVCRSPTPQGLLECVMSGPDS